MIRDALPKKKNVVRNGEILGFFLNCIYMYFPVLSSMWLLKTMLSLLAILGLGWFRSLLTCKQGTSYSQQLFSSELPSLTIDEKCWARSLPRDAEFDHWREVLSQIIAERCRVWPLTRSAEPNHCREMPSLTIDERCWARSLPRAMNKRFPIIAERCWALLLPWNAELNHEQEIPHYLREMLGPIIAERCWALSLSWDAELDHGQKIPDSRSLPRYAEPDHYSEVLNPNFAENCRARPYWWEVLSIFRDAEPDHCNRTKVPPICLYNDLCWASERTQQWVI